MKKINVDLDKLRLIMKENTINHYPEGLEDYPPIKKIMLKGLVENFYKALDCTREEAIDYMNFPSQYERNGHVNMLFKYVRSSTEDNAEPFILYIDIETVFPHLYAD